HARLADVVVLPTPPLPDVTTMISLNGGSSRKRVHSFQALEMQIIAVEPGLDRLADQLRRNRLEDTEYTCDGNQLGVKFLAEDTGRHCAARAARRPAAQRGIYVNAAVRHHFSASSHRASHDQVAVTRIDPLP